MHITDYILPDYFAPPMIGINVDVAVLQDLLVAHVPRVASVFDALKIHLAVLLSTSLVPLSTPEYPWV